MEAVVLAVMMATAAFAERMVAFAAQGMDVAVKVLEQGKVVVKAGMIVDLVVLPVQRKDSEVTLVQSFVQVTSVLALVEPLREWYCLVGV